MRMSDLIRPILVWCLLFVGVDGFLFGRTLTRALIVIKHHQTVEGTVSELPRRRPVVVSYEIGGRRYTADTSCPKCLGIATLDRLRVGDQVKVEYNPAKPNYGIPGSAKSLLLSDAQGVIFVAIFLVFAVAYFEINFRKYISRRRGPLKPPTE